MHLSDLDGDDTRTLWGADAVFGAASTGMLAIPYLSGFFNDRPVQALTASCSVALGWGNKRSGRAAAAFGQRYNRTALRLEDGFLRSVGLGKHRAATVSIVVDDLGIYYDARKPSRLEAILAGQAVDQSQAAAAMAQYRAARLSKYNLGPERSLPELSSRIVIVDQVAGDLSVSGAGGSAGVWNAMLDFAHARGVRHRLVVRSHPDVIAGRARGLFGSEALAAGIPVSTDEIAISSLLDQISEVWTLSSSLGFEALIAGIPVHTFGAPFYAGWGLTQDHSRTAIARTAFARRQRRLTIEMLFGASFLHYARYRDPIGGRPIGFQAAVERIVDWRQRDRRMAGPPLALFGLSGWKTDAVNALFGGTSRQLRYAGAAKELADGELDPEEQPVIWGMNESESFRATLRRLGKPIQRIEDGFLRSAGLGSNKTLAGSLVLEDEHLYYDATGPSRLETLLNETDFTSQLRSRAAALRHKIVEFGLTKYNLEGDAPDLRALAEGRRIILLIDQVADDPSLRLCRSAARSLEDVARQVRLEQPDAFIVFKAHPDVVAGRRASAAGKAGDFADLTLAGSSIARLYDQIDEMHLISSLAGFEGLLRGVPVTAWGVPFYAGWGLTCDRVAEPRRRRRLDLDSLVAGALILYPRYCDPVSGVPCGVEDYIHALHTLPPGQTIVPPASRMERAKRRLRKLLPRTARMRA